MLVPILGFQMKCRTHQPPSRANHVETPDLATLAAGVASSANLASRMERDVNIAPISTSLARQTARFANGA